jgi:hypothetical protein
MRHEINLLVLLESAYDCKLKVVSGKEAKCKAPSLTCNKHREAKHTLI